MCLRQLVLGRRFIEAFEGGPSADGPELPAEGHAGDGARGGGDHGALVGRGAWAGLVSVVDT